MRTFHFTSFDDLAPYADDWDRLASGMPFRGWTWLSHWWRHYGRENQLSVLGAFDEADALMGIAPWHLEFSPLHGHVLRMLGSGEVCSDHLSLLCHPAMETKTIEAMADALLTAGWWDLLEFQGVDAQDRAIEQLANVLEHHGCTVHRRPGPNCWRLDLPLDWDAYLTSLGKNLRRDARRLERNFLESERAILHTAARLDELDEAMEILVKLHQKRRKTIGEAGCFASKKFLSFYSDVVPALFRCGQVQFHWLEIDGHAVAAEFQLVGNGTLYAYQSGIDPDSLELQPGKLINLAILRQAIERGHRAFDFLRGDEPYKARFGVKPTATIEYRIVPRRAVPRLRHRLWLAGTELKKWMRTSSPINEISQ